MASRLKKGSAIAAACIAVVSTFEGLRTVAYRDPREDLDFRLFQLRSLQKMTRRWLSD